LQDQLPALPGKTLAGENPVLTFDTTITFQLGEALLQPISMHIHHHSDVLWAPASRPVSVQGQRPSLAISDFGADARSKSRPVFPRSIS